MRIINKNSCIFYLFTFVQILALLILMLALFMLPTINDSIYTNYDSKNLYYSGLAQILANPKQIFYSEYKYIYHRTYILVIEYCIIINLVLKVIIIVLCFMINFKLDGKIKFLDEIPNNMLNIAMMFTTLLSQLLNLVITGNIFNFYFVTKLKLECEDANSYIASFKNLAILCIFTQILAAMNLFCIVGLSRSIQKCTQNLEREIEMNKVSSRIIEHDTYLQSYVPNRLEPQFVEDQAKIIKEIILKLDMKKILPLKLTKKNQDFSRILSESILQSVYKTKILYKNTNTETILDNSQFESLKPFLQEVYDPSEELGMAKFLDLPKNAMQYRQSQEAELMTA